MRLSHASRLGHFVDVRNDDDGIYKPIRQQGGWAMRENYILCQKNNSRGMTCVS